MMIFNFFNYIYFLFTTFKTQILLKEIELINYMYNYLLCNLMFLMIKD